MLISKFFAELLGTFVFLSVIITSVDSHNLFESSNAWIKIGLALSVSILAFGMISGGHFNPAVSLMFYANNQLPLEDFIVYVIAQLLGALGAFVYFRMIQNKNL
jgi:glycerol uptake facilitator-like aquaporin